MCLYQLLRASCNKRGPARADSILFSDTKNTQARRAVIARRPAGANVRKVALAPLLPKTSTSSLRFVSPFAAGQSGILPLQHAGLFV